MFYGDVVTKIPAPANTERSVGGPAAIKVKKSINSYRFHFLDDREFLSNVEIFSFFQFLVAIL